MISLSVSLSNVRKNYTWKIFDSCVSFQECLNLFHSNNSEAFVHLFFHSVNVYWVPTVSQVVGIWIKAPQRVYILVGEINNKY